MRPVESIRLQNLTRGAAVVAMVSASVLIGTAAVSTLPYRAWFGLIHATAVDGDVLYMAGPYLPGAPPIADDTTPVQLRDRSTGAIVPVIAPLPFAYVYNVLADPDGGVYLFADTTTLARINSSGQLDPVFQPTLHGVPIAISGRRLAVARRVANAGLVIVDRDTGASVSGVIAGGNVAAWAAPGDGTLLAVVGPDLIRVDIGTGAVLWRVEVANAFTRTIALAASPAHTFLAVDHQVFRVNRASGSRSVVFEGFRPCSEGCPTGIEWLVINGNRLMVTGSFSQINPSVQDFLVIDTDSGAFLRTTYPHGAWRIHKAYAGGDRIYITGANGLPLGALDASTFEVLAWAPDMASGPSDVVVVGTYLITAGNGAGRVLSRTGSVAVRLSDGAPTAWRPQIDFYPSKTVAGGGSVFVAGYACQSTPTPCIPPTAQGRIAQFDATTGQRHAWSPVVDSQVTAMALSGSRLFIGGGFTSVDGVPRSCLASFDVSSGTPVLEAWAPDVSCTATQFDPIGISAILPTASGIFVAGRFTQVAGEPRHYLALLDATTGTLQPWNLITDPASYTTVPVSLAAQGSLLVVGGPAVAGRAPAVFDITRQQPVPAVPGTVVRAGTFAAVIDSEIVLRSGESLDLQTGALLATRLPADISTQLGVLVASSGIVQGLRYYPRLDVPGSPENLRASVSGFSVNLQWDAPATGTVRGYTLEAAATPDFAGAISLDAGLSLAYSTTAPAGRYYVRVRARGTGGSSPPSNVIVVSPGAAGCVEPPGAPTNPSSVVSGLSFALSWSAPAAGGAVVSYELVAGTSPTDLTLASFVLPAIPSFAATGPAGTYYWAVRARNACGDSPLTTPVTVTLQPPPPLQLPTNLRATVTTDRTVTLVWDPPTQGPVPSGYLVEAGSAPEMWDLAAITVTVPTLTVANVPPGVYHVHLHSMLGGAFSGPTASIPVTVP